tara:strand:+ start:20779 stop:21504 length:726 start_codon:yes stop_codon:yes gene_type:complete
MAGHNKWSQIKHKKAKTDAQKGKVFSKIAREIVVAAKMGGEDVSMNPRLRLALQKAKEANMPNDNVKRAIQKGVGSDDDNQLEELQFEAYGPHGIAILIDTLTDNKNRTITNLKVILNKGGGNLADKGAVSYLFETKGLIYFEKTEDENTIIDLAIEEGADDIDTKPEGDIEIITPIDQLESLKECYDKQGFKYETATLAKIPSTLVSITKDQFEKIEDLLEKLEEDDDVQDVYSNIEISD